jgi:uncharacterized membrane protein
MSCGQARAGPAASADDAHGGRALPRGRALAVYGALLLAALGLRLYRLDHQNFWIDEVYHEYVAARPVSEIVREYSLRADGGPLSLLVSHFFLSATAPERMARLPSAVFGTAAVVATALVGRRILPAGIAWLGAGFLAISPLHVWYSQEARWYSQWICFTALSYLAFLHAMRRPRWSRWAIYVAITALDLYTFVLSFAVIASQAVTAVLLSPRSRGAAGPRWLAAQAALVLGGAPLIAMILTHVHATTGSPRPTTLAALPYTVFAYGAGFSLGPTVGELHGLTSPLQIVLRHPSVVAVFAIFVPLLVAGVFRVARDRDAAALLLPWLVGPPLLVFVLALASDITYEVRYPIAALPAFALVVAAGVAALPRPGWRWVGGVALVACAAAGLANHYWNPRYAKEDVRAAVGEALRRDPRAPIVVVGQARAAVWFYANGAPIEPLAGCEPEPLPPDPARDARLASAPVLWVVVSRDWSGLAGPCGARLLATHDRVERRQYPGVELWRLERRGAPA